MGEKKMGRMMSSYYILQSFIFYIPVLTIFLKYELNDMFLVSVLFSVKSIATFLLELPTGFIADHVSRKFSIILGTIIYIVSMLIFAVCPQFKFLIIAQLLFGISETLISGADQALFYDNFKYIEREDAYQRYYANLTFLSTLALCASFAVGGIIYNYEKRGVFWLTVLFMGGSLFFLIPLKEYPYKEQDKTTKISFALVINKLNEIKEESEQFKFYLFFCSILEAMILSVYLYFIPVILQTSGVETKYFGIIFAVCTVMYGMGAKLSKYIKETLNGILTSLLIFISVFGVYVWSNEIICALMVVVGFRTIWGMFDLIFRAKLNAELKNSDIRATVFSISNAIINVISTLIMMLFGVIITYFSFEILLYFIISVFGIFVLGIIWKKSRREKLS